MDRCVRGLLTVGPSIVGAYGEHVVSRMQIRCEIKPKGHNPVFTEAHPVTIQEDLRRLTDTLELDNDTVSVYFDKKLIVSKARLTAQAITVKLHLEESSDPHELVMVAENLGEIPPNTSLLTVKAGEKRYEVRIVSTEQKNAVIVFKYEKPE